mmetsp:Transcript_76600/g.237180  ORF Transcript_76600/g.237180 Transcript_76600/m.237180 type:complete len:458 (-) Transcript_76600:74-1447(-)
MASVGPVDPHLAGLSPAALRRLDRWNEDLVVQRKLANSATLVARNGHVGYCKFFGEQNPGKPCGPDTMYRFYSMTKPICSLGLMLLYEEGRFQLTDPVKLYVPCFDKKGMTVIAPGSTIDKWDTVPCKKQITMKHVLTHTSGLSYGFDPTGRSNVVDGLYRKAGLLSGGKRQGKDIPVADFFERLAKLPLQFQPGEYWAYGLNTDLCGYLIEVISGVELEEFLRTRIFEPLGMVDTGFTVPPEKRHRFATNWMRAGAARGIGADQSGNANTTGLEEVNDWSSTGSYFEEKENMYKAGGGGLVGTMRDYYRFCAMLLNGGELDGVRVASSATLNWMTSNHLTRRDSRGRSFEVDMHAMTRPGYSEVAQKGTGFGLGVSVTMHPAETGLIGSRGSFSWGGAAATYFWIDPAERLIVIHLTQLMFNDPYKLPLRSQVANIVYGAVCHTPEEVEKRRMARL